MIPYLWSVCAGFCLISQSPFTKPPLFLCWWFSIVSLALLLRNTAGRMFDQAWWFRKQLVRCSTETCLQSICFAFPFTLDSLIRSPQDIIQRQGEPIQNITMCNTVCRKLFEQIYVLPPFRYIQTLGSNVVSMTINVDAQLAIQCSIGQILPISVRL